MNRCLYAPPPTRQSRATDEVNENLMLLLKELPGFDGYYLVDAGIGIFTSLGLSETREQGEASAKLVRCP